MIIVKLKKGKEKKIKNGYLWIFKNEISEITGEKIDGEICNVFSSNFEYIGKGIFSNSTNITVKILSLKDEEINESFFYNKFIKALKLRNNFGKSYRFFHAEADGVPGLIVDKYNEYLVVQFRNKGVENKKNEIIDALLKIFDNEIKGIYERSDFETSSKEDLKRNTGRLYGVEPPDNFIIEEEGIKYIVDIKNGQKTGFFFDQRKNRLYIRQFSKNAIGLDAYSYTGGFALNMAKYGAKKVIAVDKDEYALELLKQNAKLNGVEDVIETIYEDVELFLNNSNAIFNLVMLDPPSLIKKKAERFKGVQIFKKISELGIKRLSNFGILGLCSCAYQADITLLIESLRRSVENKGIMLQNLDIITQSNDHPWILQIPESLYLKCLWVKVLR
ncbi:23S rRNA (cytosine1962-C5)-methyltransferase [Marinitoga hydrogenitolerans DSM 16785]|uniref:23S rRNA (Cytosine1962-C5)-methyltransferase n=1 Tax=Marinitoga hydrogenitolerans (strain DSM 16785 / JCM 12826 / AT1271) TaxID=1122195 RepID=A0A1M4X1X5_MARH1|nr:class I SAM-dependent rRNA methyltransferase [Marinitoga hydrogenitolerans]SHE87455.1 23S rRNA (cytosine1962-C5)-methyltransferase [Marinitoga hydrogenitolerans DSM 16785]